jgi:hypothetical protein
MSGIDLRCLDRLLSSSLHPKRWDARVEAHTVMTTKYTIFRDVTPCTLLAELTLQVRYVPPKRQ